jgi:hypothetical protein
VHALVACATSEELYGNCLYFVANYRAVAVPLVSEACDLAESSLALPAARIQFLLSLAEAAYLLPAIRPLLHQYACKLPNFESWFEEEGSAQNAATCGHNARAVLLLLLADPALTDTWTRSAILALLVHPVPSMRWTAVRATALVFNFSNPHLDSLEKEALTPQQALDCTLHWEQHCLFIEVRLHVDFKHVRIPH